MAKLVYLLLDLGTLAAAIGMGLYWSQPWLKRWRQTLVVLILTTLPFYAWDIWATAQGHWSFNSLYITGIRLAGLPIEELLFFPIVSLAALAVWQWLSKKAGTDSKPVDQRWLLVPVAAAGLVLLVGYGHAYSMVVSIAALLLCACLALYKPGLLSVTWLRYQIVLLGLFTVFNSLLTSLPIVSYGEAYIIGWHLGTIPIEDVIYNFILVNAVVLWADVLRRQTHR
jgi:lycopene cyclase domain-containing protein